jgi:nucleotide-binding universal stress UspA family protein
LWEQNKSKLRLGGAHLNGATIMNGILLATDGGPGADGATRVASLLAKRLDVPLEVVVVYEPIPITDFGYGVAYIPDAGEDEVIRQEMLNCVRAQLKRCGVVGVVPQVRTGRAIAEIPAAAHQSRALVIVTGLGAHNLADRALGGETALRLAQAATTPVLAVPANATAIPHRALVATDFSATSQCAAQLVASWLRGGDELHVATVTQDLHLAPDAFASAVSDSETRLAHLACELHVAPGVRVHHMHLIGGPPARTLLGSVNDVHADLIALGSHGYGPVKRMLLGSVASKMIRLATTAVLVVPALTPTPNPVSLADHQDAPAYSAPHPG